MLTKNEITTLSLSPTKKDFVQIWNELLEVAGKLSERWDPTSTNESDPGIVILKALAGIADKLNYNIDKNTLEAFMPTAAQEDSMRKLCDMLGYNVKYYRSAETMVTVRYHNDDPSEDEANVMRNHGISGLSIPKFTVITNSDKDISYFTTNPVDYFISTAEPSVELPCMEGQIVKCESASDNNVITIAQLTENYRFYLPEAQIAENGIFVYNVFALGNTLVDGTPWEKVDNLNIQSRGTRVYRFGYDSYESRPYIEFPEDVNELISDGLFIYYARTSGANGNISQNVLTQLEKPSGELWDKVAAESFSVQNTFATTTGSNVETIRQAYNNFKKTVGTFEALITCRDYMNKIYTMIDDLGKPYVSNILVTDIRNDLNRAITICSCDDAGILYKNVPLTTTITKNLELADGSGQLVAVKDTQPLINHFDLVFYPFKSYNQISDIKNTQAAYDASFKYNQKSFNEVKNRLDALNISTIAHNIVEPSPGDIISINNYLRLDAIISTVSKITTAERDIIVKIVKKALADAFNMRELDFGDEIPFESIIEVIEKADPRIKLVSLNEPALYTTFSIFESTDPAGEAIIREYAVASDWLSGEDAERSGRFKYESDSDAPIETFDTLAAKELYNKLAVRNILAGRVPLFKYNTKFSSSFAEVPYRITSEILDEVDEAGTVKTAAEVFSEAAVEAEIDIKADNIIFEGTDGVTYTKQTLSTGETKYTKTSIPGDIQTDEDGKDVFVPTYPNNLITNNSNDAITEIITNCEISVLPDDNGKTAVTLSDGEFIIFRAPNFRTLKTYPAYVNYHLSLVTKEAVDAKNAVATNLFKLLDADRSNSITDKDGKWPALFSADVFKDLKKTFKLTKTISKSENTPLIDTSINIQDENITTLIQKHSCIKVSVDANGQALPEVTGNTLDDSLLEQLDIAGDTLQGDKILDSLFITAPGALSELSGHIDSVLTAQYTTDTTDPWTISYTFEYIPFEGATLAAWETFIREAGQALFGFEPQTDPDIILWYRFTGNYYTPGRYVLDDGTKLMPFTNKYFNSLDNLPSRLVGIYVAEDLGTDQLASFINNEDEYTLVSGEYLYIEYTPSTTEGSTPEPIKEVYGPGTTIRPSGFETGLCDSTVYSQSHTSTKQAKFTYKDGTTSADKVLFSLGVNEQVEIREASQVTLNSKTFNNSSAIYVYKNFNDCYELESIDNKSYLNGKRINSSYTLQEGEYILYTDKNKSELAWYTTGTQVTLTGKAVLPKFDETIDIAEIFTSDIQSIPWKRLNLATETSSVYEPDGINFQEYQYVTLGLNDTLNELTLLNGTTQINNNWQYCKDDVYYTVADATTATKLPKISTGKAGTGNGWEVCSTLALNASPQVSQTLRSTDRVKTSITLKKKANATTTAYSTRDTVSPDTDAITLAAIDEQHPISFKTNTVCQASTGKVTISQLNKLYDNAAELKSFELKVFSEEPISILKTVPNTLVPYTGENDSASSPTIAYAGSNELWNSVELTDLASVAGSYDRALKLPVTLLPETYGIFSIYLSSDPSVQTWIELLPGIRLEDTVISLNGTATLQGNRLILNTGLNCIKVTRSCDLYIKTNANSESTVYGTIYGTIYFDTLRLVDCSQTELGLNMAQLGFTHTTATEDPLLTEEQLLDIITLTDKDHIFYYNVPIEAHMAIDFLNGNTKLGTLMNPAINYDINNVNNSFVISKLDINYLTNGLQVARSSLI